MTFCGVKLKMSYASRTALFEEIERARQSTVISLCSSHRRIESYNYQLPADTIAAMGDLIKEMPGNGTLDILIDLNECSSNIAYDLAYLLRSRFSRINAFILGDAGGTGLLLGLASNSMVTWEKSRLLGLDTRELRKCMENRVSLSEDEGLITFNDLSGVLQELQKSNSGIGSDAISSLFVEIFKSRDARKLASYLACENEVRNNMRKCIELAGAQGNDARILKDFSLIQSRQNVIPVISARNSGLVISGAEESLVATLNDLRNSYAEEFREAVPPNPQTDSGTFSLKWGVLESTGGSMTLAKSFKFSREENGESPLKLSETKSKWFRESDMFQEDFL